jgi:DNA segregation ATPase FtsK/SpoIIIE, S-DNA-T family
MLYLPPGTGLPDAVHGAFVADQEVHQVVDHLKKSEVLAAPPPDAE